MTKLQKQVYILVLRALAVLLYHNLHDPSSGRVGDPKGKLRRDITDTVVALEASLK